MTRMVILLLALIVFNCGCKTNRSRPTNNSVKDSVLKRYIAIVDTLPFYDTNAIEFKLMKAYSLNDTSTLKELVERFEKMNIKSDWLLNLDSCVKQQPFEDIHSEERYRFNYSSAFCPYNTSATIIKYRDSTVLSTIVYQYARDTLPCKVIGQSRISIDSLSWGKFLESLKVADFWGLKPDNGRRGADGSTLEVYGFKKGTDSEWYPDKSSFIERWNPNHHPIFSSFILLLKYSKTKKGCITAS